MRVFVGIVAAAFLSSCQASPDPQVSGAWVRLPAVAGRPGAAYFTVRAGSENATLVAVAAKFAVRAEMHESMPDMSTTPPPGAEPPMTMRPLRDLTITANETAEFVPGGRHVMLYDIAPSVKPGEKAPITLSFANGKKIEVQAIIVAAGDPAPR